MSKQKILAIINKENDDWFKYIWDFQVAKYVNVFEESDIIELAPT